MEGFWNIIFGWHGFWQFIFMWMVLWVCVALPLKLGNRFFRSRNVKNAGWPPSHLDADGDWKEKG